MSVSNLVAHYSEALEGPPTLTARSNDTSGMSTGRCIPIIQWPSLTYAIRYMKFNTPMTAKMPVTC